jgi:type IX secretion system PorP/SprF family membrane protein
MKVIFLLIITGFFCPGIDGQDTQFSQFYSNILPLNPAFAGTSLAGRFSVSYRNQFPSMGTTYATYNAAFDMPVELLQGGLGVNVMNDIQGRGIMNRFSVDGIYSYTLLVNRDITINAGFQASYVLRSLRVSGLIFPDGLDGNTGLYVGPGEPISDRTAGYPDFAVGFIGYSRTWYAGLASHHLTRPNISFSKNYREPLPRKYTIHGGIYIYIYEKKFGREAVRLNPNLVVIQQGRQRQVNIGLEAFRNGLYSAIWFRQRRDFGLSTAMVAAGYEHEKFRFGYSYDFNVASPWKSNVGMGAHEVTFLYIFEYRSSRNKKFKAIKCPKI